MTARDILATPERPVDGRAKTTGGARYTADIEMPGALETAYARSPYPHARITRIDVSRAKALAGVRAVLIGADLRPARLGRRLQDWPVLCWDRVLFAGDRVAAVAADTGSIAEQAARLIDVDYAELPAILDMADAVTDDAPVLHPESSEYRFLEGRGGRPAVPHPNFQGHVIASFGDVDAAFATAARVFEHEFSTPRIHQAALEPHAAVLWIDAGTVHVSSTNKAPFNLRTQLAATLGLEPERIVVDNGTIGGDFGGKGLSVDEFVLYYLARATGRPVRAITRYADELVALNPRHASRIRLRTGVDAEGRIVAHEAHTLFDGGAYAAGKPTPRLIVEGGLTTLEGYRVPASRLECGTVYTNQVPGGHMRAPGQPQNVFASESHLDLIARECGIAPLELRRRNAVRRGDPTTAGLPWHGPELLPLLDRAAAEAGFATPKAAGRGRGLALGIRHVGHGTTTIQLRLERDGRIEALTGVGDQGGGQHTLIQRIVAASLDVAPDRVRVRRLSTEGPSDPGIGGSRVTPVHGGAALAAAEALRTRLGGKSVAEAAAALAEGETIDVLTTHEASAADHSACAYALEVEVDRDTGAVRIVDAVLVADVGQVINPVALRGQLEGGFVYGLGMAVMEDLALADGRVQAANLGDYKLPTIADVPPLRIVLQGDEHGSGPFGSRSAGELANPGVPAAVANAVMDACGARVFTLPITAERVWRALKEPNPGSPDIDPA
ncbi:MAG TPA: xanthine dehydrogenase family protein molybdopterin-binding subunit [Candidatus Limnocylindria bacterium]|nr:xanthine dehydrogenase family protein molybdopterin-binding subunit [Candidatus Limnocylindria bacterium]